MDKLRNNVRKYFHIFENLTANYYFDNYMSSVNYTENQDGTMEASVVIPNEIIVTNFMSRFLIDEKFSEGKLLSSANLINITDKSSEIIINTSNQAFTNVLSDVKWYGIKSNINYKRNELKNPIKLNIMKKNYSKIGNKIPLYNLFKINDLVRLKSFIFGENSKSTSLQGGNPYTIVRDLYITSIIVNDSDFEIKMKSVESQLYKVPITISTRDFSNMFDFLKAYIYPYIFKYTNIDEIIISERDFNTLKRSNIGKYRLPVGNFGLFLKKISEDYNINFLWGGIYGNNNSVVKGTKCVCFFGNSWLPPTPLVFSGGLTDGKNYTEVWQFQSIVANAIKRIDDDSNPVLVRVTSVNEQLDTVKNNKKEKVEVLWGDDTANLASALGDSKGTVLNFTTNIALGLEGMKEVARKQYIKLKYLGQFNTFNSKEPLTIRELIYYNDEKKVNSGFYFILQLTHTFDSNGYKCEFTTGTRMSTIDNLLKILR